MRLIDGDELLEGYKVMGYDPTEHPEESYMEGWCNGFNAAVNHCMHHVIHAQTVMVVNAAPTVEQPEIIRCRDCKHYYFADNRIPQEQRYVCDIGGEVWQPDDYCSYGERREESNESKERP